MPIMDGKELAEKRLDKLLHLVKELQVVPTLCIITVGDDEASRVYTAGKQRDIQSIGGICTQVNLPETATTGDVVASVRAVQASHGAVIVQLPIPPHIDKNAVVAAIDPENDVDGFRHDSLYKPCTPAGIIEMLKEYKVPIKGAHAVVVGRSDIVGKPLAKMLLDEDATVTVCHSKTRMLAGIVPTADIVVSAVGKPGVIDAGMIKSGATVIDVGITRQDGKVVGDCRDMDLRPDILYSPVPGGVGRMTRAMLVDNVVKAAVIRQPVDTMKGIWTLANEGLSRKE